MKNKYDDFCGNVISLHAFLKGTHSVREISLIENISVSFYDWMQQKKILVASGVDRLLSLTLLVADNSKMQIFFYKKNITFKENTKALTFEMAHLLSLKGYVFCKLNQTTTK